MYRDTVKSQFDEFSRSGGIPEVHYNTSAGPLVVAIGYDEYGVYFGYQFEDTDRYDKIPPFFEGCIQKRHRMYYVSFAEIDRMGYSLDLVLQLIDANITDGVIIANGLTWGD